MIEAAPALIFGLLIGSFLNVCIYRLPRDLSVVRPRSFCPHCEHPVRWYDNVPLLSFFLLRGRCRDCQGPISPRYPLVELLTGAIFFFAFYHFGPEWSAVKLSLFGALLIGLIFADLEERILPDEMTLGGTVAGIGLAALAPFPASLLYLFLPGRDLHWVSALEALLAAVVCGGALWLVGEIYLRLRNREGLGFGDVKMVAMIGAFLGLQGALLTIMVGSVLGSVFGLLFIVLTRKSASTYELPFGTFLGIAAALVAIFGEMIFGLYQRFG